MNEKEKKPLLVSLSDVEEKEAEWLVWECMPKGQINIFAGDGGSGKTTLWCGLAAAVSNGTKVFFEAENSDENPFVERAPQKVIFFSSEDSLEYTYIPTSVRVYMAEIGLLTVRMCGILPGASLSQERQRTM